MFQQVCSNPGPCLSRTRRPSQRGREACKSDSRGRKRRDAPTWVLPWKFELSPPAGTADPTNSWLAELKKLYRDLQRNMENLASLITQVEARREHEITRPATAPQAETVPMQLDPATQQHRPATQAEPVVRQPEPTPQQPPADVGLQANRPLPTQPPHPPPTPKEPPKAPPPPGGRSASFAAVAAGAAAAGASQPSRRASSSQSSGRPSQTAAPPSSFVATYHVRNKFIFKAPPGTLPDSAASLKDRLKSLLEVRLPGAHIPITDAVLFGPQAVATRVFFTLSSLEAANELVGSRCALKGSSISVQDCLTPEELKIKRALWPRFIEAKARGQRAQFHRARLVLG